MDLGFIAIANVQLGLDSVAPPPLGFQVNFWFSEFVLWG
jgi:hypothetical protein